MCTLSMEWGVWRGSHKARAGDVAAQEGEAAVATAWDGAFGGGVMALETVVAAL